MRNAISININEKYHCVLALENSGKSLLKKIYEVDIIRADKNTTLSRFNSNSLNLVSITSFYEGNIFSVSLLSFLIHIQHNLGYLYLARPYDFKRAVLKNYLAALIYHNNMKKGGPTGIKGRNNILQYLSVDFMLGLLKRNLTTYCSLTLILNQLNISFTEIMIDKIEKHTEMNSDLIPHTFRTNYTEPKCIEYTVNEILDQIAALTEIENIDFQIEYSLLEEFEEKYIKEITERIGEKWTLSL